MDLKRRSGPGTLLLIGSGFAVMAVAAPWATTYQRLLLGSAVMLLLVKAAVLLQERPRWSAGLIAYLTLWPGMDPAPFERRAPLEECGVREFAGSMLRMLFGIAFVLSVALFAPPNLYGSLGIAALLTAVHLGFSGVLAVAMRLSGWQVRSLFRAPWMAESLVDFWTRRWNLAFVEMDRILFLRPLARLLGMRWAVLGVFVISGLLHEAAISYPAGGGWGGPLLYFAIQGVAVLAERRLRLQSRLLTALVVLAPLPLLFHAPFRELVIAPAFVALRATLASHDLKWYMSLWLWVLGAAQISVLLASFQVPSKLGWKEELPRLRPFNGKLMWTYGVTVVFTVVSFAVMTLALHDELLRGDRAALVMATFMACFWTLRLIVDTVYFDIKDWPEGPEFVVGHTLLNCLFAFLVAGYGGIVVWHALT